MKKTNKPPTKMPPKSGPKKTMDEYGAGGDKTAKLPAALAAKIASKTGAMKGKKSKKGSA